MRCFYCKALISSITIAALEYIAATECMQTVNRILLFGFRALLILQT